MAEKDDVEPGTMSTLERLVQQAIHGDLASRTQAGVADAPPEIDALAGVFLSEKYQGPFAHPYVLGNLEEILPGGAERAFAMTEREQANRHEWDRKFGDAEIRTRDADIRDLDARIKDRRNLIYGLLAFLFTSMLLGFWAAMAGREAGIFVAGGGALLSVLGGLVVGLRNRPPTDRP